MEKFFATVMIAVLLVSSATGWTKTTYADEGNIVSGDHESGEDVIDALFDQRAQLMLEIYDQTDEENGDVVALDENADYNEEFEQIDKELQELGVRKIDPSNPEDIAYLKEMPATVQSAESVQSGVYDDAPDLSVLTVAFDMYVLDDYEYIYSSKTAKWERYDYRSVVITDKKDGSTGQLYQYRNIKMLTRKEILKNQVSAILEHQFEVLTDAVTGIFVKKPLLKWALGTFEDFVGASKLYAYADNEGYTTEHSSTTTMKYHYLYNPTYGWKLIASCADFHIIRVDRFVGEINALPFNDTIYKDKYTAKSGSGRSVKEYIEAYVNVMDTRPDYFVSAYFGKLDVLTYSHEKIAFEPKYADFPIDALALPKGSTY